MGVEDDYNPSGTITSVNRYALGDRGIDRIENYASSTYTYGYPLYDGHGNMRATLSNSGSSYTTSNWRSYDVWGSVRSGGTSGPKQRYCANLGHVADDESGLIYMRARYMEPASGRFISEDPALSGHNWFIYCENNPVTNTDRTGKFLDSLFLLALSSILGLVSGADGLIQASNGEQALFEFLKAATLVKNSLQLEDAWHTFMVGWNRSPINDIDPTGNTQAAVNQLSLLFGITNGEISTGLTEVALVTQFRSLAIGYATRLMWYIVDIDSF